ncbi:hypothetical protein LUZ60_010866 [Juncus effusus]|nr:hypothetical protein LUZ60_010866 [Juncus effusus]
MATACSYAQYPSFLHHLSSSAQPKLSPSHLSFKALYSLNATLSPPAPLVNHNHQIQTLCKQGELSRALELLPHEPKPTQRTFESLIIACGKLNQPSYGSAIHRRIMESGFIKDPFLSTRLIEMYTKFKSLSDARHVFENTPTKTSYVWNSLLKALLIEDKAEEALSLFQEMNFTGFKPDSFSYSYALKSCISFSSDASLASDRVKQMHCQIIRRGTDARVYVATTVIDSYAKLGLLSHAEQVFVEMPVKNVVTWSAMIGCYIRNELPYEALKLFGQMKLSKDSDLVPNSVTLVSVVQACAGLAALNQGKIIHAYILRRGLDSILSLNNALIAMYIKSGSLKLGLNVFNSMKPNKRDVVSWNSLISGFGLHGLAKDAVRVFHEMLQSKISPSSLSFLSVLSACSHCGLVEEGRRYFKLMQNYKITPRAEHYSCMVDLLGRAGQLDEAVELIEDMKVKPTSNLWGALLGACRKYCHVEYAELAFSHLFKMEPNNAGNYILLADIYKEADMQEEFDRVKELLEEQGLEKLAGCSCIEMREKVYSFVSVDEKNPQIEELHAFLVALVTRMKNEGYVPNSKVVLYDLDQEEKERILLWHSEKLALAFGIINGRKGEVVRITKNLRLCEDCHNVTKFVSRFADREILVRDVNRFHHFKDGVCSCKDYW